MAIAYFSTWTTYGTWLPGDERGWFDRHRGLRPADLLRELEAELRMTEGAIKLDVDQRRLVEQTIITPCSIRNWTLQAVNCRSNHVHVVVTAADRAIEVPREQFKSWCTRKQRERELYLNPDVPVRKNWWTQRGWDIYIDSEARLLEVIKYVLWGQDVSRTR